MANDKTEQQPLGGSSDLLDFKQRETLYGTPAEATAYVWACQNRYGFGDIVIKVGRLSRVRRSDYEAWLLRRKGIR